MSKCESASYYPEIIKNIRFIAPPRSLSLVLLVGCLGLAIYDLLTYQTSINKGTPAWVYYTVVPSYLVTALFLVFKKTQLAVPTLWIMLFALHFNINNDELWFVVAILDIAFVVYSMSYLFWGPTAVFFIYYYVFGLWHVDEVELTLSVYILASTGALAIYFVVPILVRLQVERAEIQHKIYQEKLAETFRVLDEERKDLARELHDVVAHELTIIAMQSRMAKTLPEPEKDDVFQLIGDQSRRALQEMRRMLSVMRLEQTDNLLDPESSAMSIDLEEIGEKQHQQLERLGFTVKHRLKGDLELVPKGLLPTISRVMSESVTNAIKHGATGTHIEIIMFTNETCFEYSLSNAIGKNSLPTSGFGLAGLEERVKPLGGELTSSEEAGRWVLKLKLPY